MKCFLRVQAFFERFRGQNHCFRDSEEGYREDFNEKPGRKKKSKVAQIQLFVSDFCAKKRNVHTASVPRNNPEDLKMPTTPVSHTFLNEFLTFQNGHLPYKKLP